MNPARAFDLPSLPDLEYAPIITGAMHYSKRENRVISMDHSYT